MSPAYRTGSRAGLAQRSASQGRDLNMARQRGEWRELVDRARSAAGLGDARGDRVFLQEFGNVYARTGKGAPPFEAASDRVAASGFHLLCRAFLDRPDELKGELCDVLAAGARLVDALLAREQTRAARVWQRQFGEG